MREPSGDQIGDVSYPRPPVTRVTSDPSLAIDQMKDDSDVPPL
jgi:hypothetical protein